MHFFFVAAKDLIENLLVVDIKKRYTAIDALCHPWIITQGRARTPPENMPEYRTKLRKDLEAEAKINKDHFQANRYS